MVLHGSVWFCGIQPMPLQMGYQRLVDVQSMTQSQPGPFMHVGDDDLMVWNQVRPSRLTSYLQQPPKRWKSEIPIPRQHGSCSIVWGVTIAK